MLLLFSREDGLLYIITIKPLQSTIGLWNTFKAFLFVVPHNSKNYKQMTKLRFRRMMAKVSVTQGVAGAARGTWSHEKRQYFLSPSTWKYANGFIFIFIFLLACFLFLSQDLFSCVFLQSYALFHNKYLRVIFSRHRMYLNNSCTSMIDIVPYGRISRMHSSMSMCKDCLIYHSYHLQNWRSQI